MRQLIAGNWKMNGLTAQAGTITGALRDDVGSGRELGCDLLVCPPFTQIIAAAPMLRDAGATWVVLGHSERRQNHGETDELVREKVLAATQAGLTPIVCVGETADQRSGGQETEVVGWQLAGSLPKPFTGVVAYEPVWAIGTGKTATVRDVATMHAFIREELVRQFGDAGQTI